jgi:16S rRNA (adenine1518-N6/adenine1519-N6)-dimethyltransferase
MSRQKLGQHFLTNRRILERIAAAACPPGQPLVIEIGAGRGALTEHLLARAARVVAVEIDTALVERLRRRFAGEGRIEIIQADALTADLAHWGPAVLAGNLPYYIATPLVERAITLGPRIQQSVFLIQKEVAERVTARTGTRPYGYFTVRLALFAQSEILFAVKPDAFRPPPEVDSAVVRLRTHSRAAELGIADPDHFLRFISACFRQKRKKIRNNLTSLDLQESIDRFPEASARAEQLSLEQFADLYRRLYHSTEDMKREFYRGKESGGDVH